jgi:peptidoglycan-associated lipoprotein
MRTRHLIHLLLVTVVVAGSGCTSLVDCFRKRAPAGGSDTVITTAITDVDSGKPLMPPGGAFDETRTRVTDVTLEPVLFGYDSAQLAPAEVAKIEAAAKHLLANGAHVLVIEGHCDERGSNEYNLSLGEQRANAVRTYLVDLGVAGDRVQTRSFGEEKPASQGHDESSWRLNRRGEFAVYK